MTGKTLPLLSALIIVTLLTGVSFAGEKELTLEEASALKTRADKLLTGKKYAEAVELYKQILESFPDSTKTLYNLACTYSQLGRKKEAVDALTKALEEGYGDFGRISRDKNLDNIRQEQGFKKLLKNKDKYLDKSADKIIEKYKKKLGTSYSYEKITKCKLILITNVNATSKAGIRKNLVNFATSFWKEFCKNKPDYYITVVIPGNTATFRQIGGWSGAAGFYSHANRTMTIDLSTGIGTVIHEFTHALHWADIDALGHKGHPYWVIEGFGTLFEAPGFRNGKAFGGINWRLPALKKAIANGTCWPVKDFITKSGVYFNKNLAFSYAMTRYIFYFMQEKGILRKWYAEYRKNFKNDVSGLKSLEKVYGKNIKDFEKEWLEFVGILSTKADPNRPFIVVHMENTDKGLKITKTVAGGSAANAGIKAGDIIKKVGDRKIESIADLSLAIAKHKIGDEVIFTIKRNGKKKEITVTLSKR
jgi:tetratricopeptide (TPR) repeat protein